MKWHTVYKVDPGQFLSLSSCSQLMDCIYLARAEIGCGIVHVYCIMFGNSHMDALSVDLMHMCQIRQARVD